MRAITFYKTILDDTPVLDFLDSLNAKQAQKVTWVMQLIEELKVVPQQYLKKLKNTDDIWEIRVIYKGNIFRILEF